MARSISDIKKSMTDAFMADATIREKYGFSEGDTFSGKFSTVSIENILFYIVAACHYTMEVLFDSYKEDVEEVVAGVAHRPKWYRDKVLDFMKGYSLVEDADYYDTSELSVEAINAAKVVKYAAATESRDSSLLTIKVAGRDGNELSPLDAATKAQLEAYIAEIKDVGVRINIVNKSADLYNCVMDIYYNALKDADVVKEDVENAIKDYITNLPFNGEYTNMDCLNAVQKVDGVEIVEMKSSSVKIDNESTLTTIDARHRPSAGYMKANTLTINMTAYDQV